MALNYTTTITIRATADRIWQALIDPEITPRYMYGCTVESIWTPGSPVLWKGVADGTLYVKGNLVAFEPGKKLSFTVIDPNGKYPDIPENYLVTTYLLEEADGGTRIDVSQGDYSTVAEGEQRYQHAEPGWTMTLSKLKEILET